MPIIPLIFNLEIEPLAQKIRSDPTISGIQIGPQEHRISLFADDIILMVSNPTLSLPRVKQILDKFGTISLYKVNKIKSNILDLGLDGTTRIFLSLSIPYKWAENGIPYLGITLTRSTKLLFQLNYTPFKSQMSKELQNMAKFELSWSGRLAAFKMCTLSKLLYLFRSLPIPIPTYDYCKLCYPNTYGREKDRDVLNLSNSNTGQQVAPTCQT